MSWAGGGIKTLRAYPSPVSQMYPHQKLKTSSFFLSALAGSTNSRSATQSNTLWALHVGAMVLHFGQFIVVLALTFTDRVPSKQGGVPLTISTVRWSDQVDGGGHFIATTLEAITVNLIWMIAVFLFLAGFDHGYVAWKAYRSPTPGEIEKTGSRARLVEYSVSGSLVAVAIAIEAGIRDVYALTGLFSSMWSCMIFGLLAEVLAELNSSTWTWYAHLAGWVPFGLSYGLILASFIIANMNSDKQAPSFVYGIVVGEFLIFFTFGIMQTYYLWFRTPSARYQSEIGFLILSFVAKTMLAWLVLGPVLTNNFG